MDIVTLVLAKFWGWYSIIFCMILLINPKRVAQLIAHIENEKHLVIPAMFVITLGLISVLLHNVWEFNWKLIITIFGWSTLIKGIHLFTFPKNTLKLIDAINHKYLPVFFIIMFALGILLLNQSYQWVSY